MRGLPVWPAGVWSALGGTGWSAPRPPGRAGEASVRGTACHVVRSLVEVPPAPVVGLVGRRPSAGSDRVPWAVVQNMTHYGWGRGPERTTKSSCVSSTTSQNSPRPPLLVARPGLSYRDPHEDGERVPVDDGESAIPDVRPGRIVGEFFANAGRASLALRPSGGGGAVRRVPAVRSGPRAPFSLRVVDGSTLVKQQCA